MNNIVRADELEVDRLINDFTNYSDGWDDILIHELNRVERMISSGKISSDITIIGGENHSDRGNDYCGECSVVENDDSGEGYFEDGGNEGGKKVNNGDDNEDDCNDDGNGSPDDNHDGQHDDAPLKKKIRTEELCMTEHTRHPIEKKCMQGITLPILTSTMREEILGVDIHNSLDACIVEKFGLRITARDLQTLRGLNWLNDQIINFYMHLLIARGNGSNKNLPRVYAMSTFFYSKLLSGQDSLKRWTRKVDVFAYDLIFVPIHLKNHWCMVVIDFQVKTICFYDSMGSSNLRCLIALEQYLKNESIDKKNKPFDMHDWALSSVTNTPKQKNGSDCGVFACTIAEFLSTRKKTAFTQEDMPYFREKMSYEILKGKLIE